MQIITNHVQRLVLKSILQRELLAPTPAPTHENRQPSVYDIDTASARTGSHTMHPVVLPESLFYVQQTVVFHTLATRSIGYRHFCTRKRLWDEHCMYHGAVCCVQDDQGQLARVQSQANRRASQTSGAPPNPQLMVGALILWPPLLVLYCILLLKIFYYVCGGWAGLK